MEAYHDCQDGKYAEGLRIYQELYDSGYARAAVANNLGILYLKGNGTQVDLCRAYDLFIESAEAGNTVAMNNLADLLYFYYPFQESYQDEYEKLNVHLETRQSADLIKWLRQSAKLKSPLGLYNLAQYYEDSGRFHENFIEDKYKMQLYRESADLGYRWAQMVYGMYELLENHVQNAASYFEKAKEQDNELSYAGNRVTDLLSLCSFFEKNPEYKPAALGYYGGQYGFSAVITRKYKNEGFAACAEKDGKMGFIVFSHSGRVLATSPFIYTSMIHYDKEDFVLLESGLFHVSTDDSPAIDEYFYVDINGVKQDISKQY